MKSLVSAGFELVCNFGVFVFLIGGAISGYSDGVMSNHGLMGAIFGLIIGFIGAVLVFGAIFLVMEIRDNTRKAVELQERILARKD